MYTCPELESHARGHGAKVRVSVSSAEKPVRTRKKKPPPREKGDPGGPTDDDPALGSHPSGSLRYNGDPGVLPVGAY